MKFYWDTRTSTGNADFGGVHLADGTAVTKEAYLALPVNVSYGYSINKDVRIFAFAGPTFSLGLSSKTNVTTTVLGQTKTDTIDNYAKDDVKSNFFFSTFKKFSFQLISAVCIQHKVGHFYYSL